MNVDKNFQIRSNNTGNINWFDPLENKDITIYGFPFINQEKSYKRIPTIFHENLPVNIKSLSTNTAGGQLHFFTNSSKLSIDVTLTSVSQLSGMTVTAQSGFDIYVGSSYDNLKFYDASRFPLTSTNYTFTFDLHANGTDQLVVLNFPLYNGVSKLLVGINENSILRSAKFPNDGRIVIYGTSITQGGCASRPGLSFTNILSRKLKKEIVNFGFSGNAFGEVEVATIVSNIENVDMFIIDYEANAGTNGILYKTLEDFIKIIRNKYPKTKIIVLSRIKYLFDEIYPTLGENREKIRLFQEETVRKLKSLGDENIYYLNGSKIYENLDYHEYTVDSIHPNDLGFMKIAEYLENEIRKIFK